MAGAPHRIPAQRTHIRDLWIKQPLEFEHLLDLGIPGFGPGVFVLFFLARHTFHTSESELSLTGMRKAFEPHPNVPWRTVEDAIANLVATGVLSKRAEGREVFYRVSPPKEWATAKPYTPPVRIRKDRDSARRAVPSSPGRHRHTFAPGETKTFELPEDAKLWTYTNASPQEAEIETLAEGEILHISPVAEAAQEQNSPRRAVPSSPQTIDSKQSPKSAKTVVSACPFEPHQPYFVEIFGKRADAAILARITAKLDGMPVDAFLVHLRRRTWQESDSPAFLPYLAEKARAAWVKANRKPAPAAEQPFDSEEDLRALAELEALEAREAAEAAAAGSAKGRKPC